MLIQYISLWVAICAPLFISAGLFIFLFAYTMFWITRDEKTEVEDWPDNYVV